MIFRIPGVKHYYAETEQDLFCLANIIIIITVSFLNFLLACGPHGFHLLVNQIVLGQDCCLVEEILHHFKEAGILKYKH